MSHVVLGRAGRYWNFTITIYHRKNITILLIISYHDTSFIFWQVFYTMPAYTSDNINTHGSVSCGPRSRRVTPVSILIGRKKTQFSHLRSSVLPWWNKTIFAVDMPTNCSTPHSKFERNRLTRSRDMRLQKLAQFLRFIFSSYFSFSCRTLTKTAIKLERHIRSPWNLAHRRGI